MVNLLRNIAIAVIVVGINCGVAATCGAVEPQTETSISGTLAGKASGALVLELNDYEDLTLPQNGPFTFNETLAVGANYKVVVKRQPLNQACTIERAEGVVGKDLMVDIKVECRVTGRWLHPVSLQDSLSPAGQGARTVAVAMDSKGNGIVAWSQFDGNNWRIYRAEYRDGQWQKPASLDEAMSPAGGDAKEPRVAMAANGDAVVVWEQKVFRDSYIYMAERRQGGWRLPSSLEEHISPGTSYAWEPEVAMDDRGNTVIVWDQESAGTGSVHALFKSEYRNGKWHHPSSTEEYLNPLGGDALKPRVITNNRGEVLITWEQDPGGMSQIFKSEYRNGAWLHPADVDDHINPKGGRGGSYNAMPAMDDSGGALIAWQQAHDSKTKIYLSQYSGGSWQHPKSLADSISPATGIAASLNSVEMDNKGNAIVVWGLQQKRNHYLYKSEFRAGGWNHPSLDDFFVGPDRDFEFRAVGSAALSDSGKAVVAWQQLGDDGVSRAFLVEYAGDHWYFPGESFNLQDQSAANVSIKASQQGNFLIGWLQKDDSGNIRVYASVFQDLGR